MTKYNLEPCADISALVEVSEEIGEIDQGTLTYGIREAFLARTSCDWPDLDQVRCALCIIDPMLAEKVVSIDYY